MARKAKAAAPVKEPASNISLVLLQRTVAKLQRQLEQAQDTRTESEAEEALDALRAQVAIVIPILRACLGRETLDDSVAKYDAFRALDDLSEAACLR